MDPNRFKMQFEVKKVAPDFFKPHDLAQCSSVLVLTPAKQAAKVFWVSDLPAIKEQGQTYRWIRVIEPQSDIFSAAMIEVGVRENNYFFEKVVRSGAPVDTGNSKFQPGDVIQMFSPRRKDSLGVVVKVNGSMTSVKYDNEPVALWQASNLLQKTRFDKLRECTEPSPLKSLRSDILAALRDDKLQELPEEDLRSLVHVFSQLRIQQHSSSSSNPQPSSTNT